MKTPTLSTVYLDNQAIGLMGDPLPYVAKIVAASGKAPENVRVLRGTDAADTDGVPVRLADTIDRTAHPETPIYLTCVRQDAPTPPPARVTPSTERPTITRTQFSDVGQGAEPRAPGPLPAFPDQPPASPPPSVPAGPGASDGRPTDTSSTGPADRSPGDAPEWRI